MGGVTVQSMESTGVVEMEWCVVVEVCVTRTLCGFARTFGGQSVLNSMSACAAELG